jgi:predicted RNase H-like HicB family nuclease
MFPRAFIDWMRPKPAPTPITFKVVIAVDRDEDEYHAYCPGLEGLQVGGATEEEAVNAAMQAVNCYLESYVQHGDPIPIGADLEVASADNRPPVSTTAIRRVQFQWPSPQLSGTRYRTSPRTSCAPPSSGMDGRPTARAAGLKMTSVG